MKRSRTLLAAVPLVVGLTACATNDDAAVETGPAAPAHEPETILLTGTSSLRAVLEACAATASDEQAGAVIIDGRLRDSKARGTLEQPCAILLEGSSKVRLSDVQLDGATLNITDSGAGAASNLVAFTNVTYLGRPDAGLLIELSDPGDRITVTASELHLPRGIVLHAAGLRDPTDDGGGSVRIRSSQLSVPDEDAAGITVLASEYGGEVSITGSQVDSPTGLIALAETCRIQLQDAPISCSSDDVAADLARQAQRIAAER